MALKKPSDLFGKKETSEVFQTLEVSSEISESYDKFRSNFDKVNELSERVEILSQQLSEKLNKTELENAMLSQLMIFDENFKSIQNQVKGLNKEDLKEFKKNVYNLTQLVENILGNEIPKYKKQVTRNELFVGEQIDNLKEVVSENITDIRKEIGTKFDNIADVVDNNIQYFNQQLNETSSEVKKTVDTYGKLSKILESKILKENERNDLYIDDKFYELTEDVRENIDDIRKKVDIKVNNIEEVINNNLEIFNNQLQETSSEVKNTTNTYNKLSKILENKVSKENEKLEEYSQVIQSLYTAFVDLEKTLQEETSAYDQTIEEKFETISSSVKKKIDSIDEDIKNKINNIDEEVDTFKSQVSSKVSSIEADVVIFEKHNKDTKKTIQEFSEQLHKISEIDKDITNINEDIDRLQNQYDSVSNQSIETKKDLEFIEKYIQNHHQELVELKEEVFCEIEQIPVGNIQENLERLEKKIDYIKETYSKIEPEIIVKKVIKEGLLNEPPGTKNSDPLTPLNQNFVTLDQLQQHYLLFINRIQQQLSTLGGGGETKLKYLDDIVGIATNASFYDGKFLKYNHSLGKFEFDNIDNISEENIIYVAKNGDDSNEGTLSNPKLTIKGAVQSIVSSGSTDIVVRVAPGTYIENNPIILPDEVTVIGHSLRETTVIPQNDNQDLFYVGNGNYIAEMSFRGSLPGKSVISFDPEKPRYITQSPYVQNCTNFIPDSIGLKVDGNAAIGPIKSMVLDSYTQYNQGGIGASITNQGYAQLVSLFTICNETAVYCGSGGACDLTNSNSSFGNYGLVADGVSGKKYSGIVTSASSALSDTFVLNLSVPNLSVSTAVYDNVTGIVTITTSTNHNFNVGMGVSISGLQFTCPSGPGTLTFPSGNKGYVFNVDEVLSNTQFSAYVGVSTLAHTYSGSGTVKTDVVRPFDGQAIYFNDLYDIVKTITITNGGSGYTSTPIVTIDPPSESWGVRAKAIATIQSGSVTQIDILSNGRGYTSVPNISISAPSSGINTAVGLAVLTPEYYTISKSTEISNGISTITINENVPFAVGVGTTVNFFKQSRILATGHSFEFIGSGTDIANSIPFNGGTPPNEENETDSRNGGLVVYTSTSQSGNFKIGDGMTINQNTSSITGQAYEKSLVATMTPYILSLGAL